MMRRSLLRGMLASVYGGLPPRRPDQDVPASSAGVAPGAAASVLRVRQLIIYGSGAIGLFEYNGTPAGPVPGPANPPIAYTAPPGVSKDPYGNTLPVTQGGFTASTPSNGLFAALQAAALIFGSANVSTRILSTGAIALLDALADNAQPGIAITAPSTPTGGGATIDIFGESKDATKPAQVVMGAPAAAPATTSLLEVQGNVSVVNASLQTTGLGLITGSGGVNCGVGSLDVSQVGQGLKVAEGTNAKQGTATLVAGTVTIANTSVTANSRIFVGYATPSANASACYCSSITAGTGFTVKSVNGADTSKVAFQIFEPG